MSEALHRQRLLTRATFGPRPGDPEAIRGEAPEAWVARQLAVGPHDPALEQRLAAFPNRDARPEDALDGMDLRQMAERPSQRKRLGERARDLSRELAGLRLVRAVHGSHGLREVMIDFWANHFSVFGRKSFVGALLPAYQRDVLEAHALGRFEDLLQDVARSPAMLVYLDNFQSTAPGARLPRPLRRRGRGGLNENYARELLELHTLGVDGGYSQQDVIEVARVFTGWSLRDRHQPAFRFHPFLHDDGPKRVLGERVAGAGIEEGEGLLRRLARHPSTARHLSRKLAARFVADDPPPALVERAARRYLASDGDIALVLREILLSPDFADPANRKLKTPLRFAAGALRATGGETDGGLRFLAWLGRLGEVPYYARTPAGFPESQRAWIDPGAMLERMSLAFGLAERSLGGTRLGEAWPAGLPPSPDSFGVGTGRERRALALAAPEFQWA